MIVIEMDGGLVQGIYAPAGEKVDHVWVVDHDVEGADPSGLVSYQMDMYGGKVEHKEAYVKELAVEELDPDFDITLAVNAAMDITREETA